MDGNQEKTAIFVEFNSIFNKNMDNNNNGKGLSFEIKQDIAKGTYSNLAIITHSKNEVITDFAASLPGMPKPEVVSRIVMTPANAKRLMLALQDNIAKYENAYGTVDLGEPKATYHIGGFGSGNGTKS